LLLLFRARIILTKQCHRCPHKHSANKKPKNTTPEKQKQSKYTHKKLNPKTKNTKPNQYIEF